MFQEVCKQEILPRNTILTTQTQLPPNAKHLLSLKLRKGEQKTGTFILQLAIQIPPKSVYDRLLLILTSRLPIPHAAANKLKKLTKMTNGLRKPARKG